MRTLKKTLCLVLAVVMMLGLCAFHAGATDFKDDADISAEYKEAAEVLTAVGVFKGDNGEFKPTTALTRAEGATLIARLLGYDETKLTGKSSFTDVPDWAQAAVGVCETEGIVNGYGDGRFGPSDPLTGTAFSKMLLCVLGYDVNIESLVGADWEINTSKLAKSSGVGEDMLDVITNASINRQSAAQLCLNALKSDMVEYDSKGTTVTTSDGTVVTTGASKATVRKNAAGVSYNADTAGIATTETGATLQLCEDLYGNDLKITADTTDDMGRPANKWRYKNKDVGTFAASTERLTSTTKSIKRNALYDLIGKDAYNNLVAGTDVLYVYVDGVATGLGNPIPATEANIQTYFYKDNSGKQASSGNGTLFELYKTENGAGSGIDLYTIVVAKTYLVRATANYSSSSESVKVEFLDGNTNVKPNKFPSEIDNDDFPVSDVLKDDYLLVTYSADSGEFQTVEKATELTGKVTAYVLDDSVTIDGTKHSYSATIQAGTTHGKSVPFEVGAEIKVVLDQNDNVIYVDKADASSSYVYIKSSSANTLKTKVEAEAYFTDGTEKVITVKKASFYDGKYTPTGAPTVAAVARKGTALKAKATTSVNDMTNFGGTPGDYLGTQWYTYTVDDSGEYTLKAVGTDNATYKNTDNQQGIVYYGDARHTSSLTGKVDVLDKETVSFLYDYGLSGGTVSNTAKIAVKGNSETVVVVLDNDKNTTVYTGVTNVPGIQFSETTPPAAGTIKATASYVVDSNGYVKYAFVDVSDTDADPDDSTESKDYVFVLCKRTAKNYVTTSDYYYEYDLYRDGNKEKNVMVDENAALAPGTLYHKIKTNSKGYISGQTAITNGSGYAVGTNVTGTGVNAISYDNGTITLGGSSYVLNTNNIVLLYNKQTGILSDPGANYEVDTVNGSTLERNLDGYTYTYSYYAVLNENSKSKIDELYVYISAATKMAESATVTFAVPTGTVFAAISNLTGKGEIKLYDSSNDRVVGTASGGGKNASTGWETTVAPGTYYYTITDTNAVTYTSATFTVADGDTNTITLPQFYAITPETGGKYTISNAKDGTFAGTPIYATAGSTLYVRDDGTSCRLLTTGSVALTPTDTADVYSIVMPAGWTVDHTITAAEIATEATYEVTIKTDSAGKTARVKIDGGAAQTVNYTTGICVTMGKTQEITILVTGVDDGSGTATLTNTTVAGDTSIVVFAGSSLTWTAIDVIADAAITITVT